MLMAAIVLSVTQTATLSSPFELERWIEQYLEQPRPELALRSLEMINDGASCDNSALATDAGRGGLRSFYARLLADNPGIAAKTPPLADRLGTSTRRLLFEALWRCHTNACRAALGRSGESAREFVKRKDPPNLLTANVDSVDALNDLWSAFLASGDEAYIDRVIDSFALAEVEEDPASSLVANEATFLLTSNALQHPRLLGIFRAALPKRQGVVYEILRGIIHEVDEARRIPPPDQE